MHSSIMLRETLIYGNELIICVGTSNNCVLIAEPSSIFADGFFSFTCWQLLHLGFSAFSRFRVPRWIWFSFAQKPPPKPPLFMSYYSNSSEQSCHSVLSIHKLQISCEKLLLKNWENKCQSLSLVRLCRCGMSAHQCRCCNGWNVGTVVGNAEITKCVFLSKTTTTFSQKKSAYPYLYWRLMSGLFCTFQILTKHFFSSAFFH